MRLHESAPESAAPRAPSHPHRRRTVARSLPRRSLRVWIKEIFSSTRRIRRRSPSRRQRRRRRRRRRRRSRLLRLHRSFPLRLIQRFVVVIRLSVRRIDFRSPPSRQLRVDVRSRPILVLVLVLVLVLASSLRRRVVVVAVAVAVAVARHRDPSLRQSRQQRFRERAHRVARCRPAGTRDRASKHPVARSRRHTNAKTVATRRETHATDAFERASERAHTRARERPRSRTKGVDGVGSGRADGERRTANGERRTANGERRTTVRAGARARNRVDPRERWKRAMDARRRETLRA